MYGDVVLDMKPESKEDIDPFEEILHAKKAARGVKYDSELTVDALQELVAEFKAVDQGAHGARLPAPSRPTQLRGRDRGRLPLAGRTIAPTSTAG